MTVLTLLLCACDGASAPEPAGRAQGGRFQAVPPSEKDVEAPAAWCDTWTEAESAKKFPMPGLATGPLPEVHTWRWVNVWATWCGPCVAEMPTLVKWKEQLAKQNVSYDLVFLSVDEHQPEVDRFLQKHPDVPGSVRLADFATLPAWLAELGLEPTTAIPIQLFVDPENRVRCIRTGSLADHHLPTVRGILQR